MKTTAKKFFRWYWEHCKSAFSFGGYVHPLSATRHGLSFWKTEWRASKSLLIVALLPQAFLIGLALLAIAYYVAMYQLFGVQ